MLGKSTLPYGYLHWDVYLWEAVSCGSQLCCLQIPCCCLSSLVALRSLTVSVFVRCADVEVTGRFAFKEKMKMRMRMFRTCLIVSALVIGGTVVKGETIDDVEKKIAELTKKVDSVTGKSTTVTKMDNGGFSMTSTMTGTMEMQRKGDEFLMRTEITGVTETTVGENTTKQEGTTLVINDGTYTYTLTDNGGVKNAFRVKSQKQSTDPLQAMKEMGTIKLVGEEKVDSFKVWAIEMDAKQKMPGQGRTIMYFDQKTGQMVKMISYSDKGEPMTTMTVSELKINQPVKADRFIFKAPAGVEVMEM